MQTPSWYNAPINQSINQSISRSSIQNAPHIIIIIIIYSHHYAVSCFVYYILFVFYLCFSCNIVTLCECHGEIKGYVLTYLLIKSTSSSSTSCDDNREQLKLPSLMNNSWNRIASQASGIRSLDFVTNRSLWNYSKPPTWIPRRSIWNIFVAFLCSFIAEKRDKILAKLSILWRHKAYFNRSIIIDF